MKTYAISTGGWTARINAPTGMIAAACALKRDKPRNLGMLVEIKRRGEPTTWWDTREALKMAGLSVRPTKRAARKAKKR